MPAACNSRTADGARTADRRAAFFHRTACPPADIARDYLKGLPCTALEKNCTKSPKKSRPAGSLSHHRLIILCTCGTSVNLVHSQPPLRGGQVFKGKVFKGKAFKGKGLERKSSQGQSSKGRPPLLFRCGRGAAFIRDPDRTGVHLMKPPGLPDSPKLGSGGGGGRQALGICGSKVRMTSPRSSTDRRAAEGDRLRPAPTAVRSWSPSPGRRPTSDSFNGSWRLPTTSGHIDEHIS